MRRTGHLSAHEAADALGVSRATLYAYVSRGLVRSERQEGSRARRYRAEDVWMLLRRREGRRDPARAAEQSLYWGAPVLASELTLSSRPLPPSRTWPRCSGARPISSCRR
jgi:citrate synthase